MIFELCCYSSHAVTLSPPSKKEVYVFVFICQMGHLGTGNGSWVLSLVGLVEEHRLSGDGSAKTLGGPSTFKLWQPGHNRHGLFFFFPRGCELSVGVMESKVLWGIPVKEDQEHVGEEWGNLVKVPKELG
jgi:hypothetical protein